MKSPKTCRVDSLADMGHNAYSLPFVTFDITRALSQPASCHCKYLILERPFKSYVVALLDHWVPV